VLQTVGAGVLQTTPNVTARLARVEDPHGNVLNLSYDAAGQLTNVRDNLNLATRTGLTFAYHPNGRLRSVSDWTGRAWQYSYDADGNLASKIDYQGKVTTYQYDGTDRLVAETNPEYLQVGYHYDGAGRLLDRILSNGAHTRYAWDAAGRLTQLTNTTVTGQVINDTTYTRDRIGNILTQSETAGPNAHTRHYAYDAGNRLKDIRIGSATGPIESTFTYDANGSLLTETGPRAKTLTWNAQNRPSQINGNTFQYDASGYRISKTDSQGTKLCCRVTSAVFLSRTLRPVFVKCFFYQVVRRRFGRHAYPCIAYFSVGNK
jgi:YD repeat-containing protein